MSKASQTIATSMFHMDIDSFGETSLYSEMQRAKGLSPSSAQFSGRDQTDWSVLWTALRKQPIATSCFRNMNSLPSRYHES